MTQLHEQPQPSLSFSSCSPPLLPDTRTSPSPICPALSLILPWSTLPFTHPRLVAALPQEREQQQQSEAAKAAAAEELKAKGAPPGAATEDAGVLKVC